MWAKLTPRGWLRNPSGLASICKGGFLKINVLKYFIVIKFLKYNNGINYCINDLI